MFVVPLMARRGLDRPGPTLVITVDDTGLDKVSVGNSSRIGDSQRVFVHCVNGAPDLGMEVNSVRRRRWRKKEGGDTRL